MLEVLAWDFEEPEPMEEFDWEGLTWLAELLATQRSTTSFRSLPWRQESSSGSTPT